MAHPQQREPAPDQDGAGLGPRASTSSRPTPAQGFTMRVEDQQLSELAVGHEGQPDVVVTGTSEDFCDMFWGDLNPSEKYMSGRDHAGGLAAGRDADRRHLHGGLPRYLSWRDARDRRHRPRVPGHAAPGARPAHRRDHLDRTGLRRPRVPGRRWSRGLRGGATPPDPHHRRRSPRPPGLRLLRRAQRDVPDGRGHPPLHEAGDGRPRRADHHLHLHDDDRARHRLRRLHRRQCPGARLR